MKRGLLGGLFLLSSAGLSAPPPGTARAFVACPIVRDTQTVPCWLAEYEGEVYYLGVQSDEHAAWRPPLLGHRVLVEGTIADAYRICGGIVLMPVRTSILPELDSACNTVLPAEDRYTVPYATRGAGPARVTTSTAETRAAVADSERFAVEFEFDTSILSASSASTLEKAFLYAQSIRARQIEITGYRSAVSLSDGTLLVERSGIAEQRAKHVAESLQTVGISPAVLVVQWRDAPEQADVTAFGSRRATINVKAAQ